MKRNVSYIALLVELEIKISNSKKKKSLLLKRENAFAYNPGADLKP
jgi:hypothetical protein